MTTPTTEYSNIIDVWVSAQPRDLQAGDYVRYRQAHFNNEEREGEVFARAGYLSDGVWVLRYNSRPDRFSAAVTPGSMEVRRKGFIYSGVTYVEGDEVSLTWHSCWEDCDSYTDCLGGAVESVTGTLLYRDGTYPSFSVEHPDGFVICTSSSSPDEVGGVSNLRKLAAEATPESTVSTPESTDVETLRRQHEEWKANLARDAIRLAQDHGYCTVVENFLREHGVTPTARGYRVTAQVEVEIDFDLNDGRHEPPTVDAVRRMLQNAQFQLSPITGTRNTTVNVTDSTIWGLSPRS